MCKLTSPKVEARKKYNMSLDTRVSRPGVVPRHVAFYRHSLGGIFHHNHIYTNGTEQLESLVIPKLGIRISEYLIMPQPPQVDDNGVAFPR